MERVDKLLTPQQELFLASYTDPTSETFSNALRSALKAGYSQEYAENITHLLPDWLSENIGDMKRLRKAESNLDEVQNINIFTDEGKPDPQLIDKRTKVDFFFAETLNKTKYSKRNEHTGKNGGAIEVKNISGMKIIEDNE
jgi:predicted transcriptional regulator